jgi:hypothetical protein
MKKLLITVLALGVSIAMLTGCTKDEVKDKGKNNVQNEENQKNANKESKFVEKDGLLEYSGTENNPFDQTGFKIIVKKGNGGYAKFIKTDLEGRETVDYYTFDYSKNTVEKYYYVSAMGTAFYYYFDLEKNELAKVENAEHKDSTESMKTSGRWDKAASGMIDEVKSIEDYFVKQFGKSIKDFVLK